MRQVHFHPCGKYQRYYVRQDTMVQFRYISSYQVLAAPKIE